MSVIACASVKYVGRLAMAYSPGPVKYVGRLAMVYSPGPVKYVVALVVRHGEQSFRDLDHL